MRTAPEFFDAAFSANPEARAVAFFDTDVSYDQINSRANSVAAWLADQGVGRSDRVVVQLQNVPQFVMIALAIWRVGAVLVPVNPMYKRDELAHAIRDSGAGLFIGAAQSATEARAACALAGLERHTFIDEFALQNRDDPRVHLTASRDDVDAMLESLLAGVIGESDVDAVALQPNDPALICYTSGTTGSPKGAVMTHDNIAVSVIAYRDWWQIPEGTDIAAVAPLCHITGIICGLLLPWLSRSAAIMTYRFQPDVLLEAFSEHRPGFMAATATAYQALLASPAASPSAFSSFRTLCSGGAALPTAVLERFQLETGHYVYNGYGLTETSAACMSVPFGSVAPTDEEFGVVSTGRMLAGFDIRVLDDAHHDVEAGELGEIAIAGRGVFGGYWQRPEATAESFAGEYFLTGDIGCVRDGWIYVLDRKKELINASGFKVSPREVEDVLYRHPAVREAGVTAIPDDYRGEAVLAVISLLPGASVDVDEVRAFVKERLAAYKVPATVIVVDELPKNTNGKILRRELAALAVRE